MRVGNRKSLSGVDVIGFSIGNNVYDYAKFKLNSAYNTERAIELPVIEKAVRYSFSVLEVGNVLKQYYPDMKHDVIDKYDKSEGIIKQDILNYRPGLIYDLVVSISTVEHCGFDEPIFEPTKCFKAIKKIKSLGKRAIITFPLGYNSYLDNNIDLIEDSKMHLLKRISLDNRWIEVPLEFNDKKTYNYPYPYGNWILFMVFE